MLSVKLGFLFKKKKKTNLTGWESIKRKQRHSTVAHGDTPGPGTESSLPHTQDGASGWQLAGRAPHPVPDGLEAPQLGKHKAASVRTPPAQRCRPGGVAGGQSGVEANGPEGKSQGKVCRTPAISPGEGQPRPRCHAEQKDSAVT